MSSNESNDSLAIEKEKTKRYFAMLGVGGVVVVILAIMFFSKFGQSGSGSFKVTKDGVELSIDKPLIDQVEHTNRALQTGNDSIEFTTGSINEQVIEEVQKQHGSELTPKKFVGRNLIDTKGRFVLASNNSSSWKVQHNNAGYSDVMQPIVHLTATGGESVTVHRMPMSMFNNCNNIRCAVQQMLLGLEAQGLLEQSPLVEYDDATNTAFLTFTNPNTLGQSYVKAVVSDGYWYEARADYNTLVSDAKIQRDAVNMIASFAIIR